MPSTPGWARHVRVEHWANALNQPAVAAGSILGRMSHSTGRRTSSPISIDLGMECTGHVEPGDYDTVVFRGDPPVGMHRVLDRTRGVAGMNVNIWDVTDDIKALVQSGRQSGPRGLGPIRPGPAGACR